MRPILVVEDEFFILEVVVEVLGSAGYNVIAAANGQQALEHLERLSDAVAMVLTDIVMPGTVDGIILARMIRAKFPTMPLVFMTGTAGMLDGEPGLEVPPRVLRKPFRIRLLLETVAHVLALPGAAEA